MATSYDAAVEALYRGPLDTFVAERKRLAGELKTGGDKTAAARLLKLGRPSMSAWAVNQLFWHEREAFERLLATAERLRSGGTSGRRAQAHARDASVAGSGAARGRRARRRGVHAATRDDDAFRACGFGWIPTRSARRARRRSGPARIRRNLDRRGELGSRSHASRCRTRTKASRGGAASARRRPGPQARRAAASEAALRAAQTDATAHRRDAERLRYELGEAERKLEKALSTVAALREALRGLDESPGHAVVK